MRLGALPLAVPIGDEEPEAPARRILVSAHEIVFCLQDVEDVQLEKDPFARLPVAHGSGKAIKTLPNRHGLTRGPELQYQQGANQERERQSHPDGLIHGTSF
jgi:hypothetical protein